jgi:hypothetical protein
MNYIKLIYLIFILLFAIISSLFVNRENFENIHTLNLDESKFYPEACGSIISYSGSSGCPKLTNIQVNELLSRGNNNSKLL